MTFEEWRDQHLKQGAEDFSKRGTPTHLYGCNRDCLREAWEAARADLGITTSADSDAKVTPADGSITLGPDAVNFAEATGDATAEADEIPPQRVKAPHYLSSIPGSAGRENFLLGFVRDLRETLAYEADAFDSDRCRDAVAMIDEVLK